MRRHSRSRRAVLPTSLMMLWVMAADRPSFTLPLEKILTILTGEIGNKETGLGTEG